MRDVVVDVRVDEGDGQIRAEDFPELTVDPILGLGIEAPIGILAEEPDELGVVVSDRRTLSKPVRRQDPEPISGGAVQRGIELSGPHPLVLEAAVQDLNVHPDPHPAELVLDVHGRCLAQVYGAPAPSD